MNPPRVMETGSAFDVRLLRAARADGAPAGSEQRALAALGLAAAGSGGATAGWLVGRWLFKVCGGIALVATAAVATSLLADRSETVAARVAPGIASAPASVEPPAMLPPEPSPAAASSPSPAPIARPARPPSHAASPTRIARPSPASSAPAASVPSLADELAEIERAKAAVRAHDADAALAILRGYAQHFPHGVLAEEAEVVRVDALAMTRDRAATAAAADAFLLRHPESAYAQHVRSVQERAASTH